MQAHEFTLKNGLPLLVIPTPGLPSATVTAWVRVGSRFETKEINGLSHFLEHMVFKGGKNYPTAQSVSESLDAIGADFNAGTSKEYTNYYVRTQVGALETACDVLSDIVLSPHLSAEELEKERGVIIEEINMYEDTPMYRIGDIFEQTIFDGNPLGWDIAGTKENIRSMKRSDFKEFHDRNYTPSNMLLTIAGGITPKEALKLAEKYFGGVTSTDGQEISKHVAFTSKQLAPRARLNSKKIEQAHMIMGFFGNKLGDETGWAEDVLSVILGGGMSSRLFTEVREKRGLAYTVRTSPDHMIDAGSFSTYAGVDTTKAYEALKVILDEHVKLATKKVTAVELKKAKEYLKGHFALSLESTKAISDFFGHDKLMLGTFHTPEEEIRRIEAVTAQDIQNLAQKLFIKENLNLAVIGPFDDKTEFEKILSL